MNKVEIFGNAGAGKSTLAKQLANATGLPLYSLDKLQFRVGAHQYLKMSFWRSIRRLCNKINGS